MLPSHSSGHSIRAKDKITVHPGVRVPFHFVSDSQQNVELRAQSLPSEKLESAQSGKPLEKSIAELASLMVDEKIRFKEIAALVNKAYGISINYAERGVGTGGLANGSLDGS